jgi:Ca-activated chloride channel family protein
MSGFVLRRASGLALSLAAVVVLHSASIAPEIRPDLQAGVTLVQIPVSVTDFWNRPVLDLHEKDFRVFEDGVEQVIQSISSEDAPVSVGILADTSASMGGKRTLTREALQDFLGLANREDRFCLFEFKERTRLLLDFPAKPSDVLSKELWDHTNGQTALLDAVNEALAHLRGLPAERKALLVISDGGDNRSRYTEAEIRSAVREADVRIYAMGIVEPIYSRRPVPELVRGPELLRAIADDSGGHAYLVEKRAELADAARKIGLELRNQYLVSYKPSNPSHDGKYHEVVVKVVADRPGTDWKLAWRRGYYAPGD